MSSSAPGAHGGPQRKIIAATDVETPEEVSRRSFMAGAVTVLGGIIGLGLAVPIVGSLLPTGGEGHGRWAPLSAAEFKELQAAISQPVKLIFTLKGKDAYLPEQASQEYVWGIKTDPAKFRQARPDIYVNGKADVPYHAINLGLVIFSPICPHLGCRYAWSGTANKFLCPCHGSEFTFEGEHIAGPAPRGLDPLPLREQAGIAQITWIRYQTMVPDRIVISYLS